MRAAVVKNLKEFDIKDLQKPTLKDKGAIIKIIGCGLCGSDIVKLLHGSHINKVLGHEVLGTIEEINSTTSFKKGDKVVLAHHIPCFNCDYCRKHNYSMCEKFKKTNITPGGFAEYIYITEDHLKNTVFHAPQNLNDSTSVFMEPLACCLRAIKRANTEKNDNVMVIGLGSIGLLMGQAAKCYGAKVSGCDILDERIALAQKVGFDNVFKSGSDEKTSSEFKSKTKKTGADIVFLTSGSKSSLSLALKCVRNGGVILVFASISDDDLGFANNQIYYRELTVLGSYSPACSDLEEALTLLKDGKINVNCFKKEYSLDNINNAISDTLNKKILKAYIKI